MSDGEGFVGRLLPTVRAEPARALVRLRLHLREQGPFERGFNSERCERDASLMRAALRQPDGPLAVVHPLAALAALDRYLAEEVDRGFEPRPRRFALPAGEGGGEFWLVPRRPGWSSRFSATQSGHVEYWMRHYQVVPAVHRGIEVRLRQAPPHIGEALAQVVTPFAAGGFLDGVLPRWISTSPYRCRCLADAEKRRQPVEALLDEAARRGAVIVVLPELTVDPDVRQCVRAWLRGREHGIALVAAGSFHEPRSVQDDGPGQGLAYLLDAWGERAMTHTKLRPMRAMPKGERAEEDLEGGRAVELLLVPFGLLGLAICLDFCDSGDAPVADLWTQIGPALMLVPSMGDGSTNSAHRRRALDLARQHATVTVVASQHPTEVLALGLCWGPGAGAASPKVKRQVDRPVLFGEIYWTLE